MLSVWSVVVSPPPIMMHRAGLGVLTSPMGRMRLPNAVFRRSGPCLSSCPLSRSLPLSFPHPLPSFLPPLSLCPHYLPFFCLYLILSPLPRPQLPQLIKCYPRTGFICIWLRSLSAVGGMFIKWLRVEGCSEPILL